MADYSFKSLKGKTSEDQGYDTLKSAVKGLSNLTGIGVVQEPTEDIDQKAIRDYLSKPEDQRNPETDKIAYKKLLQMDPGAEPSEFPIDPMTGLGLVKAAPLAAREFRALKQGGYINPMGKKILSDAGIEAKVGESFPNIYGRNLEHAESTLPGRTEALLQGKSDEQLYKDLTRNKSMNQYTSEDINSINKYAKAKGIPLPGDDAKSAFGAHQGHIDGDTLEQRGWTYINPNQSPASKVTTALHEKTVSGILPGQTTGHQEELRQLLEKANGDTNKIQQWLKTKSIPYDQLANSERLSTEYARDLHNLRQLYPEADDLANSQFLSYLSTPENALHPAHSLMADNIRKAGHFQNAQNLEFEKSVGNLINLNGLDINNLTPDEVLMFSKNKNINKLMESKGIDLGDQLREIVKQQMQPKKIIVPNKSIIAPSIQLKKP